MKARNRYKMDLERFKILHKRFAKLPLDKKEWDTQEYDDYIIAINESKECSDWYLKSEMDKQRFDYSNFCCLELAKHISDGISDNGETIYDDVDIILRKWDDGTVGIPIHDGGESMIEINYCPFCGKIISKNT